VERKPAGHDTSPGHETVAVVLQVREGELQVLLWQRALAPHARRWALPGGRLGAETLERSIRRHLAAKVDVRELSHLEQLETRAEPRAGRVTTAYLGLVRTGLDPAVPPDTRWHPVHALPPTAFDHGTFVFAGRERLRAKLSYTNLGFALAPETFTISELRDLYAAALGHVVSATNLQRVLLRRGVLVPTGERRPPGRAGGRPAEVYRFRAAGLEITDQFAVLRPPDRIGRG
jgi:ADP-ribose pyrophosphatase YjhB (NUDIX family)